MNVKCNLNRILASALCVCLMATIALLVVFFTTKGTSVQNSSVVQLFGLNENDNRTTTTTTTSSDVSDQETIENDFQEVSIIEEFTTTTSTSTTTTDAETSQTESSTQVPIETRIEVPLVVAELNTDAPKTKAATTAPTTKNVFYREKSELENLFEGDEIDTMQALYKSDLPVLMNFAIVYFEDGAPYYYVTDPKKNLIHVFDEMWRFMFKFNVNKPFFITSTNDRVFVSRDGGVFSYDFQGNELNAYKKNAGYRGSVYDEATGKLYVASIVNNKIEIFDKQLNLVREFVLEVENKEPLCVYLKKSGEQLYVCSGSDILKIENEKIVEIIQTECKNKIASIVFDKYDNMAVACRSREDRIYFHHSNGTYLNKSVEIKQLKNHIGYDVHGRLILVTDMSVYLL